MVQSDDGKDTYRKADNMQNMIKLDFPLLTSRKGSSALMLPRPQRNCDNYSDVTGAVDMDMCTC